ncbi:MAG: MFS transporter [Bacilli bacterium]|nr:MFS transporter [Bacilli bacterium]
MKKEQLMVILFFFVQNIIHNLGHPVTPAFVENLGIQDYMFGVFFAAMSFGLMIGGPIWGSLGDRGKKKPYIIIGLIVYSIGQFFFGYSNNQYLMVLFRFLSGIGVVSAITLLTSHMIELTPKDKRAKFLAYNMAVTTLGAAFGYLIGGFISQNQFTVDLFHITNYKEIFLIQSILNIGYVLLILFLFKDKEAIAIAPKKTSVFSNFKFIKSIDYRLFLFLIALMFITIGSINLNKFIDVYFNNLSYNPFQLGIFKMVIGCVTVVVSIFLVPYFARMRKQIGLMMVIQLASAIIVFFSFRSSSFIITIYTLYMLYIILLAVFTPLEQNYISLHAKEGEYGKIMGIRQSFLSIGMVIGPLFGGVLYDRSPLLMFDSAAASFILGFLILVIIGFLYRKRYTAGEAS